MIETLPLLENTDFPALERGPLTTVQVNLGYLCNQQCQHCHVNAGPKRTEIMDKSNINHVLDFVRYSDAGVLDLTGGAPELNPNFRYMVQQARSMGIKIIDRCNLTVLSEPGQEDLAKFLAQENVDVVASLPCYSEQNVDQQRGSGVFQKSIDGLRLLNSLGYGKEGSGLVLNLVYNPIGPHLPPSQVELQRDYKLKLMDEFQIEFNTLMTITNMPIQRFGSVLVSKGQFKPYMQLLRDSFQSDNLDSVMCKNLVSIDWKGYVYDCDFNQMLKLPSMLNHKPHTHVSELSNISLEGKPIVVLDHCYGCTAGQGSSCGGALS